MALGLAELKTALEELVDNTVLHADRDEPTVAVSVEVHDEWVDLQVADDGPGIPPMEYESLDSERLSPLSHDTGFGLNLVYWIVRHSGGQLLFEERSPRGSVVKARLQRVNG